MVSTNPLYKPPFFIQTPQFVWFVWYLKKGVFIQTKWHLNAFLTTTCEDINKYVCLYNDFLTKLKSVQKLNTFSTFYAFSLYPLIQTYKPTNLLCDENIKLLKRAPSPSNTCGVYRGEPGRPSDIHSQSLACNLLNIKGLCELYFGVSTFMTTLREKLKFRFINVYYRLIMFKGVLNG